MFGCPFSKGGLCVPPGETTGPPCSFDGSDYKRLCAVYPMHKARKDGDPMSPLDAMQTAYQRGFAQEAEQEKKWWQFWK